ncbi:MAG: glycosyltransferase family 4 protein [Anaerolineales bacterium]|nr:glycosyltransferase family 4 protein [Anaerolineales bacterium]
MLAQHFVDAGYVVHTTSSYPNRILRLVDMVLSLIRWRKQIDIVVVMVFSGSAFFLVDIASWLSCRLNIPLILWLHGGNLPQFAYAHEKWVRRVYQRAQVLVVPSAYLVESANKLDVDVEVIPNILAIDNYAYHLRQQVQPKLLWMRTFHEIYNPTLAIQVVAELVANYPDIQLTMAGQDKGLLQQTRELVEAQELTANVQFAGFLDMPAKQTAFESHDIFLNTNKIDNMPVSVVEAAAFGLPIVATNVGGIPHLLKDSQTALLVEDGDVLDMANAVRRLLNDPDLSARLSYNGRRLAETCSWTHVQAQWETVFQQINDRGR